MKNNAIGITEGCDPTLNLKWIDWVRSGKPAILITKMPQILLPMLKGNENIIIHCSITGWGTSLIEPNISSSALTLKAYHELCKLFGANRVVLRIDPIIYNDLDIILPIKDEAEGRIRISFIDMYPHVKTRFKKANIALPLGDFHMPLDTRKEIWNELGKPEICCEPDMPSVPCVSEIDCEILGVKPNDRLKGQRPLCGCLANKVELCTRPPRCSYGCLYCYWK